MTTAPVAFPNRNAVDEALTAYLPAMRDFIVFNLRQIRGSKVPELMLSAAYGDRLTRFQDGFNAGNKPEDIIDVSDCLPIILKHWKEKFSHACNGSGRLRNRLGIITEGRNATAHFKQQDMSLGDAIEYLNAMATVLEVVGKQQAQLRVADIRDSLLPASKVSTIQDDSIEENGSDESREAREASVTTRGLKPWSEVIEPHPDILNGQMTDATFAANLQQVADGDAPTAEYRYPIQFFTRSYITPGLKYLLVNTVKRLTSNGGDPVIQMKTGFGGGKTHSLIALWHLVKSCEELCYQAIAPTDPTGEALLSVFQEAGFDPTEPFNAKAAVLIGTSRSATEETQTSESGDPLNTLWGHMAYQLGGQSAYNIIGNASRNWVSPGGTEFDELFKQVGPCVILMDELVAYSRNLDSERAGRFYTFLQNLTESVGRNPQVALVVTVPQSKAELGGDAGVQAAAIIENVLGRIETISAPLETHEAFEVVRRRLFQDVLDEQALKATCASFQSMYSQSKKEFPTDTHHASYEVRMQQCYPIHPEVFDRLHTDWSTIHDFQRTRGVLRLLAIAIRRLYHQSNDPLIMPGNLPLADSNLSQEFTKVLSGNWDPVIKEIDGINCKADIIDHEAPRFLRLGDGAAKRTTRTIFLGSVPGKALTGLDDQQIRLGCVEPDHNIADYNEARSRLNGRLYFLHESGGRYFLRTEPNLNKLHQDIVDQISDFEVDEHIRGIISDAVGRRVGDVNVVVFPQGSEYVPDNDQVQLVVLHPDHPLPSRESEKDAATPTALGILRNRGDQERVRRNMVVYLAARRDEIRTLRNHVRAHLAWVAIVDRVKELGLTPRNQSQARRHEVDSRQGVANAVVSAYRHALVPRQPDPLSAEYDVRRIRVPDDKSGRIGRSTVQKLIEDEELNDSFSTRVFVDLLEQFFWRDEIQYLDLDEVWDRLTELVYLPRLLRRGVLNAVAAQAEAEGIYAIAASHSGTEFVGLEHGRVMAEGSGLLVRRSVADAQRQRNQPQPTESDTETRTPTTQHDGEADGNEFATDTHAHNRSRRVTGIRTVTGKDAVTIDYNQLRDEIAKHLNDDGGDVKVTITIEAEHARGFSEEIEAGVRQNGSTLGVQLRFDSDYSQ